MWGGEGGAGSGLESLGWPHTRPSREPFGQENAGRSLWAAKDCHSGISPQGGGLGGHPCSLCVQFKAGMSMGVGI